MAFLFEIKTLSFCIVKLIANTAQSLGVLTIISFCTILFVFGRLRDPITRKLVGAKCKFVAFWWNRPLVLQDMYNTKCTSPFFVQLLGIKLNMSIPNKLPVTASFVQNICDTELYKSLTPFIWGWQSLGLNSGCPATLCDPTRLESPSALL